eukprot:CAMPEP_0196800316 /NCGR_PEP_ID=MMETSP1104-20130614/40079_1 /TAXON_ID=33652 /ORGANISM="Cafeteria sp., Strain Caron Lab Isolate" /LENGTH=355 /DNA_ID=CAMNT_0042170725 /DNA_START=1 /DNA_END=1065 /DNA_ORIENTATION=+
MQSQGHRVYMYTSHHSPGRAFSETTDGTLDVRVHGDWIPRHLAQRGHILFSHLRNVALAVMVGLFGPRCDVYVCDQVSSCIPVLRLLCPRSRVIFYCHFPDQLLARHDTLLKRLYRLPFDVLEEVTTGMADEILVNSAFTRGVFRQTFRLLRSWKPKLLYPTIRVPPMMDDDASVEVHSNVPRTLTFLSINRYERKKDIALAVRALRRVRDEVDDQTWRRVQLVIAGGYDERVRENVEYYAELRALAESLEVDRNVKFIRSFSDDQKRALLESCLAVLYTPANEHFGIVPLECMAASRPVIAVASGGPLETVQHDETGYLCEPEPDAFARAMLALIRSPRTARVMGARGRSRVIA